MKAKDCQTFRFRDATIEVYCMDAYIMSKKVADRNYGSWCCCLRVDFVTVNNIIKPTCFFFHCE